MVDLHRGALWLPIADDWWAVRSRVCHCECRMLQEIRSYLREMNVSEQLADAMLRIEPAKFRLLYDATLIRYGLTATDPIEQETRDLQDAKSSGLSRQEYMRRRSIAGRMCPSGYYFGDRR